MADPAAEPVVAYEARKAGARVRFVVHRNLVVRTAPMLRRFLGQRLDRLVNEMEGIGWCVVRA